MRISSPSPWRLTCVSLLCTASAWATDPLALPNPGFEEGTEGWTISKEDAAASLSQISPEAAHAGSNGLRVKQGEEGVGSWMQSSKVPIEQGQNYRLSFFARCVENSGIGVWVQYFNSERKPIKQNPDVAIQIPQSAKDWTEYHLDLAPPEGAVSVSFAVHSYSKRPCLADFDDFSVTPIDASQVQAKPAATPFVPGAGQIPPPDPARVKEIAAFLSPTPRGVAPSLDNRAAWDLLAADAAFRSQTLGKAERFLKEPIPDVDAGYAASVQSGDRKVDALVDRRRFRLATMLLAEGMENQGRFLPAIEKEIAAICSEPSWILSGHVKFTKGNDLGTAMTAWNLATAATMLQGRISEDLQKKIRTEVRSRVIEPYLASIRGQKATEWWAKDPNNWNAVVHGGIVGASLALDESIEERAEIIAAAEKETQFYIKGFPEDGYSTEGMGYWKYGFGHYVLLAEAILAATDGKVDLYARDNIRQLAQFYRRFEIAPYVYPAYSDAPFDEQKTDWLFHIIDRRYGLNDDIPRTLALDGMFSTFLYAWGINLAFDPSAKPVYTEGGAAIQGHQIRDWFDQSQILISRLPKDKKGLVFSMKGGNNGTSHGHNDLGTFVVAYDDKPLLVDPGSMPYNGQTFSAQRYQNQINNSYGHSVPKVAGVLQKEGSSHFATVVDSKFSDQTDSVTLDITKGYEVPSLKKLTRKFDYSRENSGEVVVTDVVEFDSPQSFGTALVTFGEAREEKPGTWVVTQGGKSVKAEISVDGQPFTVTNEVLKDVARPGKVRRLGIDLDAPVTTATVVTKITPVEAPTTAAN